MMTQNKQLLNIENERRQLGELEEPVMEIQSMEVKNAIHKMNNGKTPGPSEVQIEVLKVLGMEGDEWILELLRVLWGRGSKAR